jgi:hypothetical protein
MKTSTIVLVLLLLSALAGGAWWFFIREKDSTTPVKDTSFMIGNIYGTSNLSTMYEFIDSTTVKYVQSTSPCSLLKWDLKTASTLEIEGKGTFTLQSDSLKSADGEMYTKLTGDITAYCDLIGKNV